MAKNTVNEAELTRLQQQTEEIDYTAIIARLGGHPLTEEQKEACRKFDELYDATHSVPNAEE